MHGKSLPTNDCSRRSESGAHQTSCDLHSCCFAMVLTAGFNVIPGLILFGKFEWSNRQVEAADQKYY